MLDDQPLERRFRGKGDGKLLHEILRDGVHVVTLR
jgi:hypothetical protein